MDDIGIAALGLPEDNRGCMIILIYYRSTAAVIIVTYQYYDDHCSLMIAVVVAVAAAAGGMRNITIPARCLCYDNCSSSRIFAIDVPTILAIGRLTRCLFVDRAAANAQSRFDQSLNPWQVCRKNSSS